MQPKRWHSPCSFWKVTKTRHWISCRCPVNARFSQHKVDWPHETLPSAKVLRVWSQVGSQRIPCPLLAWQPGCLWAASQTPAIAVSIALVLVLSPAGHRILSRSKDTACQRKRTEKLHPDRIYATPSHQSLSWSTPNVWRGGSCRHSSSPTANCPPVIKRINMYNTSPTCWNILDKLLAFPAFKDSTPTAVKTTLNTNKSFWCPIAAHFLSCIPVFVPPSKAWQA